MDNKNLELLETQDDKIEENMIDNEWNDKIELYLQNSHDDIEIVKKSENPTKGQEEIFKKIIEKNPKYDKEMGELEKEIMNEKEDFKQNNIIKNRNNGEIEDIWTTQISHPVGDNLINICDKRPTVDSKLNNDSCVNDYNNMNEINTRKTKKSFLQGWNKINKGK